MHKKTAINADEIRQKFSKKMSEMYRQEVPAYGVLVDIVEDVNTKKLAQDKQLVERLNASNGIKRISQERHGAIRLGTAAELNMMRRVFAIMGMYGVGYYNLSIAGIPVHSTAFRPIEKAALDINPFRVFTSLLRLEFIADKQLRDSAKATLEKRQIFSASLIALVEKAESCGKFSAKDVDDFINEAIEVFRWHSEALVTATLYNNLYNAHRLIADIVCFKTPHINHLTPRTLDIDEVQRLMPAHNIAPKAVIEGPPARKCPILLRQTSFKALEEKVSFTDGSTGSHTARFGEIEQRGAALTPKGQALYDELLDQTRAKILPNPDGSNAKDYYQALSKAFKVFPDDWAEIHKQELAYFSYSITDEGKAAANCGGDEGFLDDLLSRGLVRFDPIVYEDFLPVSAAGIFQSNLGDEAVQNNDIGANQAKFEQELGTKVIDRFEHYAKIEQQTIDNCLKMIRPPTMLI